MVHVCVNVFDLEARSSSSFVADKGTLSEDTIHIFLQQIGKVHVYSGKIKVQYMQMLYGKRHVPLFTWAGLIKITMQPTRTCHPYTWWKFCSLLGKYFFSFYFSPSAAAMCTLQSKGVVHRDLKPQNLLLHHSGMTTPSPSQIKVKIGKLCSLSIIPESPNRYHHGKVDG